MISASHSPGTASRRGFTLIEMIVTISILLVLMSLGLAFLPRVQEKQRVTQGADQLQGWLLVAKQWALRDRAPRGLRILRDTTNPNLSLQVQYIEQPPEYIGGQIAVTYSGSYSAAGSAASNGSTIDFYGGFPPANAGAPTDAEMDNWAVQPDRASGQRGDYLVYQTGVGPFRVTAVNSATSMTLEGPSSGLAVSAATTGYRLLRAPRPRTGEAILQFPQTVAIDLGTNTTYGNTLPSGNIDILFAPSGMVLGWTGDTDKIQLWIRDLTEDTGAQTEQNLITVYTRTGMISAHRIDPTSGDPYSVTRDGRSSGL